MARVVWVRVIALVVFFGAPAAADSSAVGQAVRDGELAIDLNYRLESVDQAGLPEEALAQTLRARIGYGTAEFHGWSAYGDVEAIVPLGGETYNDTANGKIDYPVVADREDEEINQLFLGYSGPRKTRARIGRQRIIWDNARFIGNVGWRQNEQTFDALSVSSEPTERLSVSYAHLNNANRIFGEHHPDPARADFDLAADLLSAAVALPVGKLTVYAHGLELEDAPAQSHRNLGLRYQGERDLASDLVLAWVAEYADQADYQDGASSIDASYKTGEIGLRRGRLDATLGYEELGGDGVYGFATPLATLHAFNGWADQFATTPASGLRDAYASFGAKVAGVRLLAVYHDFSADSGGANYGTELDLLCSRSFTEHYAVELKYARYSADDLGSDTRKFWLSLRFKL